jgi:hypothetical protein
MAHLTEPLDEIELAKYTRMAVDAQSGHFATYIYGDQSHIDVLAEALQHCAYQCGVMLEKNDDLEGQVEGLRAELSVFKKATTDDDDEGPNGDDLDALFGDARV